ncbi:TetR/AcrR family transcriptional regulator [Archangium violaceum]|uniref:TetR/AcrR family transcriptional regulator n=1 Tax=Archangium violaceum TaxID=83451 RepID=UPI0019509D5C|nr:TetR/AcrR family transcriptional regulator [Archangium violaceum]QRN97234.1 TetR/AcrR family transcriptional regulator [Archangium violaceum]
MGITERKQRQKAELREHILTAARDIVLREGFGGLSMRKLAEAVEYAPATLYVHFQNRDEIARELSRRGFQELLGFFEPVVGIADPLERLRAVAEAYVRFGMGHPETYRLVFMEDPKLSSAVLHGGPDDPGARSFHVLEAAFEELAAQGRLAADADPRRLAEVFWTGVHGVVSLKLTCTNFLQTPAEALTDTFTRTFLDGLPKPSSRSPTQGNAST